MTYQQNQDFPTNNRSVTVWSGSVDALVAATEQPGLPSAMEHTLKFLANKTNVTVIEMRGRHLGPLVNQELHASTLFAVWLPGNWAEELPNYAAVEEPAIWCLKTPDLLHNHRCLRFPGRHRQLNFPSGYLACPLDENNNFFILFLFIGDNEASLIAFQADESFGCGLQGAGISTGENYRPFREFSEEELAAAKLEAEKYKNGPPDPEWHIADCHKLIERT